MAENKAITSKAENKAITSKVK
ncbi:hypothetical protein CCACVL1_20021 [Corchorus capsularis]|uniref:Uncharacterized protein n=1 Tax=Corchorus capsularis TaxID=210143 RepID=A0A1R3HD40_COCAP|nr:hypothetical protein CCACVL1_20021 [Corchorus capsularis]